MWTMSVAKGVGLMRCVRWERSALLRGSVASSMVVLVLFVSLVAAGLAGSGGVAQAASTPVEIRFAAWASPGEYDEIIDAFHKANPDIKVKFEPTSWGAYWTQLQTRIAGGAAPDVMRMSGAYMLNFAADGALLPLDDLVRRDKLDMSQYFNTGDIFLFGGKTYGLPEFGDIVGVYYNVDRLEEAGVAAPGSEWTWNDMAVLARKLTVRSGDQVKRWGLMLDLFIGGNGQTSWVNFLLQNGTRALSDDKRRAILDAPAAIEAIEFLAGLYQKDRSIPGSEVPYTFQSFADEKAAMMYALVPIGIPIILGNAKFRWDIAPVPKGKRFASETNFVGFAISSQSKQQEAAWRFVKFLAGPTAQSIIARKRQGIPALKSAAYSREFLIPYQAPRRLGELLQVTTPHTYDLQFTPGWSQWTTAADSQIMQAVLGAKAVDVAMKAATEQVNKILDQQWRLLDAKLARTKR